MADQTKARACRGRPAAEHGDKVVDIDAARGRAAAQDVPSGDDRRAVRHDAAPEVPVRIPGTAQEPGSGSLPADAVKALERSQWAILRELRAGRKCREQNPPALPSFGPWSCEQCGTTRPTFDDLVHHQFAAHPETFAGDGVLVFDAAPCECRQCSGPAAYLDWLRTPEARGAKG